ncbi:hypothetical protein NQ318_006109 [Aromia moschata]|uniref:Uncharacterized protein n=1 Tax=Aromia moschata TaxID=1265417 RepID=A0AAV8Z4E6_9CUCU|nr:hypothetical protein NQ318_006109 [Aromia moschata]
MRLRPRMKTKNRVLRKQPKQQEKQEKPKAKVTEKKKSAKNQATLMSFFKKLLFSTLKWLSKKARRYRFTKSHGEIHRGLLAIFGNPISIPQALSIVNEFQSRLLGRAFFRPGIS